MTRVIGILIIGFFLYYIVKVLFRMFINNLSKKAGMNIPPQSPPKPKNNLDKSKAVEAQFEELK